MTGTNLNICQKNENRMLAVIKDYDNINKIVYAKQFSLYLIGVKPNAS